MQASISVDKLKHMGEIKITTYRGGKLALGSEFAIPQLKVCDQVSEKMMKGRLIKNNVKNVHWLYICLGFH